MQDHEIEASIAFLREELRYTPAQISTALDKGLSMLAKGAKTFAQEMQGLFPGKSLAEVSAIFITVYPATVADTSLASITHMTT